MGGFLMESIVTTKFIAPFRFIAYSLIINDKQLKKFRKKHNINERDLPPPTTDADVTYLQFDGYQYAVVQIRAGNQKLHEVLALLTHECVHIKQRVMRNIAEDYPSDEFEAYFVQELTTNIFNEYFKLTAFKSGFFYG